VSEVSGLREGMSKQIASETLVDEANHELLVLKVWQLTRDRRGLEAINLPESKLVVQTRAAQEQCSTRWQKVLVQLVTAVVSLHLTVLPTTIWDDRDESLVQARLRRPRRALPRG
jgi:hypothetical protein